MKVKDIEQRQCNRFTVLNELYIACNADTSRNIDISQLAYDKGIKNGRFKEIYDYLLCECLIAKPFGSVGESVASITHTGVKMVEYVITHPDNQTDIFPPFKDMGL